MGKWGSLSNPPPYALDYPANHYLTIGCNSSYKGTQSTSRLTSPISHAHGHASHGRTHQNPLRTTQDRNGLLYPNKCV
eukprot:36006-Eustigmatos_ZCMA.PRE.1